MKSDFHLPGRSPVVAGEGMAATSHPLATLAAVETLRAGGTAADAAVTAVATLSVLEPQMTGIGGDCFCLVAKPGAPLWGYNGSGRSGATARAETLIAQGIREVDGDSVHSVTVPGAVEAWNVILMAHGRFGLDGRPPAIGDKMKYPALAATLRAIAAGGPKAFYEGAPAADIVATLRPRGSFLTREDFAAHRGEVVEPISSNYRGLDVVELPPNGQGLAALVLLNILERFDMPALDPLGAERFHLQLEAGRLAYAVRDTHIADPKSMRVSVAALLDKVFAGKLAALIDRKKRVPLPPAPTPGSHTVLMTVVDRDRTAVTMINSLYSPFGVAIATEQTGILLHNRGSCFVVDPAHPNTIDPGKRPMHTIIPALAMRDGRCDLAFGVMGGGYQSMGHAHFIVNLVDYGMDVQAAIEHPRVFFAGEVTEIERGISAEAVAGLKSRGHDVALRLQPFGGGQAIRIDWQRGVLIGGSDHRKDGCAIGY